MNIDPDSNPNVDDIRMPNGHEKNKFLFQNQQILQNNDGKNVASVKKCNTYYPKVLPLKWICLLSFSLNCLMSKLKNEIKDFKLDLTSTICLIMKLEIESHYSKWSKSFLWIFYKSNCHVKLFRNDVFLKYLLIINRIETESEQITRQIKVDIVMYINFLIHW